MSRSIDNRCLRVGLTGGIASGKSTVADFFAALGVPVIDTDIIAREIVEPGQPALDDIEKRFGPTVFTKEGRLLRRALRRLIFEDSSARGDLERLLHPRIGAEVMRQSAAAGGPYHLIVVPLLVGSDLLRVIDRVLVVDCDEKTQIRRLLARDAETIEQARRILASQASREERLSIADDIVTNEHSLSDTKAQVKALDRQYRAICQSASGGAEYTDGETCR